MTDSAVSSGKQQAVREALARLGVREADLIEKFILGAGHGGQKLNKTSSCVYLRHAPSGIEVKCGRTRSREMNRFLARRELCDRLAARLTGEQTARQQAAEKIRRQKRRRSRRQKERLLEQKHRQADKKRLRQSVASDRE